MTEFYIGATFWIERCVLSGDEGEYIIYYRDKIVGGIYDNRFLVKPTKFALTMMSNANTELPYDGTNEMLLVDDVDNKDFLHVLLESMYDKLPALKKKKWDKEHEWLFAWKPELFWTI